MTVDTFRPGGVAPSEPRDTIAVWLSKAADADQLARGLVRSFFVPAAYKADRSPDGFEIAVANATGAILLGDSLGIDPLTALQQIHVVHGRPGMYAKFKVALAQAAGHRVWDEVYSAERAVVCGQRKGTDDVVRIEVTIEDARRAKWTENAAYTKTPADMLWARAASRVVDRIAADLLMGIRSIEDIDPDDAASVEVTVAKSAARPSAAAALAAAAGSEPRETIPADVTPAAPPASDPAAEPAAAISDSQWRAINARFVELGVKGEGQAAARLRVIVDMIGREVTRGGELTADEATLVLDNLTGHVVDRVLAPEQPQQDADPLGGADPDADQDAEQALADWHDETAGGE